MKKLYAGVCAATACCLALALTACNNSATGEKTPEKLKDGDAFSLTVGDTKQFDLTEYISVAQTDYTYTVKSSEEGVLTVALEENTATVTAVSHGNAVVTATAGEVSVTFAATVNGIAPVFDNVSLEYDLYTAESKEITLAPKSGESTYSYSYALKTADENVTISGNKLTAAYTDATEKNLTVVATYTDSAVTGGGKSYRRVRRGCKSNRQRARRAYLQKHFRRIRSVHGGKQGDNARARERRSHIQL